MLQIHPSTPPPAGGEAVAAGSAGSARALPSVGGVWLLDTAQVPAALIRQDAARAAGPGLKY